MLSQSGKIQMMLTDFWKKHFRLISFVLLVVLFGASRFYQLAEVPRGMTWDEAAIGYNGYAIVHQRRDEWLEKLPISFRSFGDYKAPLAIYISGISTFVFGMNLWAVRFPFAFAAVGTLIGLWGVVFLLFKQSTYRFWIATLAGIFLLTSPWHHHFSRVGFESGMALMFLVWGVLKWLLARNEYPAQWAKVLSAQLKNKSLQNYTHTVVAHPLTYQILAVVSVAMGMYTYHSAKVAFPLFFGGWALVDVVRKKLSLQRAGVLLVVAVVLLAPLVKDSFFGAGMTRAETTTWLVEDITVQQGWELFATQASAHLSPQFLLQGEVDTLRHGDGVHGILTWPVFGLLIAGILSSIVAVAKKQSQYSQAAILGFSLVIIGLLPAIIGTSIPHPNRALLALPGFFLLATYGGVQVFEWMSRKYQPIAFSLVAVLILLELSLFAGYLQYYYGTYQTESWQEYNEGFLEAMRVAVSIEKREYIEGWQPTELVINNSFGQSYIYVLFARQTMPISYQQGSAFRYKYVEEVGEQYFFEENKVLVVRPTDRVPDGFKPLEVIKNSVGEDVLYVYLSQPHETTE